MEVANATSHMLSLLIFLGCLTIKDVAAGDSDNSKSLKICPNNNGNHMINADREAMLNAINGIRQKVANGAGENYRGFLPQGSNIYKLEYDCNMETELETEVGKLTGAITLDKKYA
ncbi:unnamed protein product [Strongylus vulgaris]|uniref:SCP domain-containing protein n=1 Tax=Strongylus vulgaris TaxID=40348 RepID=A0A3P7IZQ3_STRVU|nr:unnamed protein product [Strongylus vulgaris]